MALLKTRRLEHRCHQQADLSELRGDAFRLVLWGALGLAILLLLTLDIRDVRPVRTTDLAYAVTAAAAILVVAWGAYWFYRQGGVARGSGVLLGGLGLFLVVGIYVTSNERLIFWFAALVILASSLLGGRATLLATIVGGMTIASSVFPLGTMSVDTAVEAGLFTLTVAVVSWLSSRPIYLALQWAYNSYQEALEKTEELRDHQLELSRTLQRLRQANESLEYMNYELARAREAAEEARHFKAQFAANVSHELRTPLNHIIGFADIMMTAPETYGVPLPPSYRGDLEAIHRSAQHLSRLIDDVLDLSQLEAGRMGLVKEKVALSDIVREAVEVVSGIFAAKRLDLAVDLAEGVPIVYVDRTRIRQVIINLLGNAARFTERGRVVVATRVERNDVLVSVRDTGIGIAPEDLPKVFEEFRQLDGSTSRRHGGSGLGLTICRRFVELHGGIIWVTSELGKGTSFSFSVPLSGDSLVLAAPPDGTRHPLYGFSAEESVEQTVVVVAEDPAVPRVFQRHLDGFRVLGLADREQIPKMKSEQPIHAVVVTATSAPEGWRKLQEMRNLWGEIPLVACSVPRKRGLLRDLGFAGHLTKPISREVLQARLQRLGRRVKWVLIVDDDPDTVRLLSRMVTAAPERYRVYEATNGEEALALMQERKPDAVLLDLAMPGLDGYGVLQRMREDRRLRRIPVVAVTGRYDPEEAIVADAITVTRGGGLVVGELISCLNASLNAMLASPGRTPERAPTPAD